MKNICKLPMIVFLAFAGVSGVAGCDDADEASSDPIYLFDASADYSQYPLAGAKEIKGFGAYPNDIAVAGNFGYIVDYSNNAVHRIDLTSGETEFAFIDLGQNAGPYSVYADDGRIFVTVQGANAVWQYDADGRKQSVIDAKTLKQTLVAPTDIAVYGDYAYIADSGYNYADPAQTKGTIFSLMSDGSVESESGNAINPAFLRIIEIGDEAYTLVSDAGVILYNSDYTIKSMPERACAWMSKIGAQGKRTGNERGHACAKNTSIGSLSWDKDTLYVGDATKPQYHTVALSDLINGKASDDNLKLKAHRLSDEDYTTTIKPLVVGNALAVLDSAKDTLHWIEDGKETVFALSQGDVRKMPIDAEYDAKNNQIVILNSASGTVDFVKVK